MRLKFVIIFIFLTIGSFLGKNSFDVGLFEGSEDDGISISIEIDSVSLEVDYIRVRYFVQNKTPFDIHFIRPEVEIGEIFHRFFFLLTEVKNQDNSYALYFTDKEGELWQIRAPHASSNWTNSVIIFGNSVFSGELELDLKYASFNPILNPSERHEIAFCIQLKGVVRNIVGRRIFAGDLTSNGVVLPHLGGLLRKRKV